MALSPEEQWRWTVAPAVVTGSPASRPDRRARFPAPWAPWPRYTSSTASGSTPDFSTADEMAWAAIDIAGVMLNPPRPALARPVRAYDTTTASRMDVPLRVPGVAPAGA